MALRDQYRERLRATVGSSAAPYGYTLATWTTRAALTNARGMPDALVSLAFMAGAVLGFGFVGALAFGRVIGRFGPGGGEAYPVWGSFHGVCLLARFFGRFLNPTPRGGCRRRKRNIRSSQVFCKPYLLLW